MHAFCIIDTLQLSSAGVCLLDYLQMSTARFQSFSISSLSQYRGPILQLLRWLPAIYADMSFGGFMATALPYVLITWSTVYWLTCSLLSYQLPYPICAHYLIDCLMTYVFTITSLIALSLMCSFPHRLSHGLRVHNYLINCLIPYVLISSSTVSWLTCSLLHHQLPYPLCAHYLVDCLMTYVFTITSSINSSRNCSLPHLLSNDLRVHNYLINCLFSSLPHRLSHDLRVHYHLIDFLMTYVIRWSRPGYFTLCSLLPHRLPYDLCQKCLKN